MRRSKNTMVDESRLQLSDFEIIADGTKNTILGKGSFATVHLARCKRNDKKYAMKIVK